VQRHRSIWHLFLQVSALTGNDRLQVEGSVREAVAAQSAKRTSDLAWGVTVSVALIYPALLTALEYVVWPVDRDQPMQIAYRIGQLSIWAIPVLAVRVLDGRWPRPMFMRWRGMPWALAFGLGASAAILALYFVVFRGAACLEQTVALVRGKLAERHADRPSGFLLLAVIVAVGMPLLEEYYWRWFVFGTLQRLVPLAAALLLSAGAFAANHAIILAAYFPEHVLTMALPLSGCVAIGGLVWAWLYHQSGSIYPVWLSHLIIDVALMTVIYDMAYRPPA
jgi:membrane protease YdiL (CAAX protease family)